MAKRVDVSRLTWHEKLYLAGFRKGMQVAMGEARILFREEVDKLIKELVESRADFQALATRYHRLMLNRAIEEAQHERETHPGQLLH
jgi:hypothetical protein